MQQEMGKVLDQGFLVEEVVLAVQMRVGVCWKSHII